jgi:hypothetical protein
MTQNKTHNFALEGRIKDIAADNGVRQEVLDTDLVERIRAGEVTEANIADKLKEWKAVEGHHFFNAGGATHQSDADNAFGEHRTLKAQGAYVVKYGEQKASETATSYGVKLGSIGKPNGNGGDHSANPFTKLRRADGSIDPAIADKVAGMTRAMGTQKVAAIAASVGKTITGLPLRGH